MSIGSKIQWTDATWNPVTGCTRVSAGCDHCYAVRQTHRLEAMGQEKYAGLTSVNGAGQRHFNGVVRCHPDALEIPIRRRKPTLYFVNSMSDLFHDAVPPEFIDQVFAVMAICPQHVFQILTKRPQRMAMLMQGIGQRISSHVKCWVDSDDGPIPGHRILEVVSKARKSGSEVAGDQYEWNTPLPNAWLGVSVENEESERGPHGRLFDLYNTGTSHKFVSYEPAIGPIPGERFGFADWVIIGGESGPGARPFDTSWALDLIEARLLFQKPVFVKQLGRRPIHNGKPLKLKHPKGGDIDEWPEELRVRELPAELAAVMGNRHQAESKV